MAERLGLIPVRDKVKAVVSVYRDFHESLMRLISSVDVQTITAIRAIQIQNKSRQLIDKLNRDLDMASTAGVKVAYAVSIERTRKLLEMLGAKRNPDWDNRRHVTAMAEKIADMIGYFRKANSTIMPKISSFLTVLEQTKERLNSFHGQIQEFGDFDQDMIDDIFLIIAEAVEEGKGIVSLTGQIFNLLFEMFAGAELLTINGRNFNMFKYAEMVARTEFRRAQTTATKNLCLQWENDLWQYSQHANPCEICAPYEGLVFSISGTHPDYPQLPADAEPPTHPRCEHNLNPTSERAIKFREMYG